MATKSRKSSPAPALQPRLRVTVGADIAIGPGKAELLAHIDETGSLADAAKAMGMSYMRAWTLIQTMNRCFKQPLVNASRGGRNRGGTGLSETGRQALALYQKMDRASQSATKSEWSKLQRLLRSGK